MQDEAKAKKFEQIITLLSDSLTKTDFEKNFRILIDFVKKLKEMTAQELQSIKIMLSSATAKIESDQTSEMADMKKEMMMMCEDGLNKVMLEKEAMTAEMDKKMSEMSEAMPDESVIAKQASDLAITAIKPLIPDKVVLEEKIPKLGAYVRDSLEKLEGDDRLDKSAIKGLDEEFKRLEAIRGRTLGGGGFSLMAMTQYMIYGETPTDSGDHLTFTLAHTPVSGTLTLYRSRARQNLTEDYSISGKTITLTVAFDSANESLICDYIRN